MSDGNEELWKDERYAIYDLSVNSAIAFPAHDERIPLSELPAKYNAQGYAYGGGGRRITRVDISLDKGKSWRLASIDYTEDRYRDAKEQDLYGGALDMSWRESSFCWCFWNLEIPFEDIRNSQDIFVRAMDESMNLQPRDMYWSVLGMMNNPWFRVVVHVDDNEVRFEHPTQPALMPGGWMERIKKAGGNLTNGVWGERLGGEEEAVVEDKPADIKMTRDGVDKVVTIDELRKHDTGEQPWFVVNGEVYDGTKFLEGHPGGAQSIISSAGLDASEEFMAIRKFTSGHIWTSY
jgi:nitrate reductase (NAD(P)H)